MLPVYLKVTDALVLVVGGGHIAARKVAWLLEQTARVRVVALEFCAELVALAAAHPAATLIERAYQATDCHGVRLVIAATDDENVNRQVATDAEAAGLWVNVVDRPALCSFFVPASSDRGPVQIAVGTGGNCPALAAVLRDHLVSQLPEDIGEFAMAMGALRKLCLERFPDFDSRARAMRHAAKGFVVPNRPKEPSALLDWLLQRALKSVHMT